MAHTLARRRQSMSHSAATVETVRTRNNNAIRLKHLIFVTALFCRLHKNIRQHCRYCSYKFYAEPYRQNERTLCFYSHLYREIAVLAPSPHRYFCLVGKCLRHFAFRLLRYLRSDIRFPLCLLFGRVLRSASF